jgi:DNA-binding GntR family transcriptional regulator
MNELAGIHRDLQAAADPHDFTRLNGEFLRRLVFLARSRRVSATIRLMAVAIVPGDFFAEVPEAIKVHKRHLRTIMKALKAGDGEAAEREMITLLGNQSGLVVQLLTSRGVIGDKGAG